MGPISDRSCTATYADGLVKLDGRPNWPDGTKLDVTPVAAPLTPLEPGGHVIIVGFGLAGRAAADLLDEIKLPYSIIERNPVTVETQRALGRDIVEGSPTDPETLTRAGLHRAAILALTIPDEETVLSAISVARRLSPDVHIIARTNYSSMGMKAAQLGADDVIKAEQAVAQQFYDRLRCRLAQKRVRMPQHGCPA